MARLTTSAVPVQAQAKKVHDLRKAKYAAAQEQARHTAHRHWKTCQGQGFSTQKVKELSTLTKYISKSKDDVSSVPHARVSDDTPLQVGTQEPLLTCLW